MLAEETNETVINRNKKMQEENKKKKMRAIAVVARTSVCTARNGGRDDKSRESTHSCLGPHFAGCSIHEYYAVMFFTQWFSAVFLAHARWMRLIIDKYYRSLPLNMLRSIESWWVWRHVISDAQHGRH